MSVHKSKREFSTTHPQTGMLLDIYERPEVHAIAAATERREKRAVPLARRIGRSALTAMAIVASAPNALFSDKELRPSSDDDALLRITKGAFKALRPAVQPLTGAAENYKQARRKEATSRKAKAHSAAVKQYIESNPDEVVKLEAQKQRHSIIESLGNSARQQHSIIKYLTANQYDIGRNAGSLVAQSIPRRPSHGRTGFEGSYDALARTTLIEALVSQRQSDGSIALLGDNVRGLHAKVAQEVHATRQLTETETMYNGGVATALWKLGFVDVTRGEAGMPYGEATFNPDVAWSQDNGRNPYGETTTHRAQLPFDPANELHALLLPAELKDNPNLAIELEFSGGVEPHHGGYVQDNEQMSIRVIPTMASQELAAA